MAEHNLTDLDVDRIAGAVAKKLQDKAPGDTAIVVKTVVQEMTVHGLSVMGIDLADKKQMAAIKEDLNFVRHLRMRCERVGQSVTSAITNAIMLGIFSLLVIGFLVWTRGGGQPPGAPTAITK